MFKRIVFSQFKSFYNQGKDPMQARTGSLMLVSVLILMLGGVLLLLNISALPHFDSSNLPVKTIGRVAGIVVLFTVYGLLFLVLGKKSRFENYWIEYCEMDAYQRDRMVQAGTWLFLIPFILLFVLLITRFLK